MPRVYIETTIPSFYHSDRTSAAAIVRSEWTRRWWHGAARRFSLVTSKAVLDELSAGTYATQEAAISLVRDLPRLEVTPAIAEIVQAYGRHKLMPDPAGDALHLALASFHRCDFLLTWNCQHLANANKFGHIRRVNGLLGLFVPALVTPIELLGGDNGSST